MNLRHLEIFLEVCQQGSITQAAEVLFISQPAVSKSIRELENSLSTKLFDRVNGKLFLNETGKAFRIRAKQFWHDYQKIRYFGENELEKIPLNIGVSLTIASEMLFDALKLFKASYPNSPLKIYAENVKSIQNRLLAGEIDIGFIEGTIQNEAFDLELLSQYQLLFIAAPEFVERNKGKSLAEIPLLLREKGSSLRDHFDYLAAEKELNPAILLESTNTEVLIKGAKQGLGVTILPENIAKHYFQTRELVKIDFLDVELFSKNHAVSLKGKIKDQRTKKLMDIFMTL